MIGDCGSVGSISLLVEVGGDFLFCRVRSGLKRQLFRRRSLFVWRGQSKKLICTVAQRTTYCSCTTYGRKLLRGGGILIGTPDGPNKTKHPPMLTHPCLCSDYYSYVPLIITIGRLTWCSRVSPWYMYSQAAHSPTIMAQNTSKFWYFTRVFAILV